MPSLVSPGSQITVTDESFGTGSGPGTVPLIILATAQEKLNASGDDVAVGTLKENANKLYLISSQRELLQTFGLPNFNNVGGNSLHAYPLNEYGLLAAHSYLGISNRAYCVRADIDLDQLQPSDFPPSAPPKDGTYWVNPANIDAALYKRQSGTWVKQNVYMHTGEVDADGSPIGLTDNTLTYVMTVGVYTDINGNDVLSNQLWLKSGLGAWEIVNSVEQTGIDIQYSSKWPTVRGGNLTGALVDDDLWINTNIMNYDVSVYDANTASFINTDLLAFNSTDAAYAFFGNTPAAGTLFLQYDAPIVTEVGAVDTITDMVVSFQHVIKRHNGKLQNKFVCNHSFPTVMNAVFTITSNGVTTPVISISGATSAQTAADTINTALMNSGNIVASVSAGKLVITNTANEDMLFVFTSGSLTGMANNALVTNWDYLAYEASSEQPVGDLAEGTLWYSADFAVDILINNGTSWDGITSDNLFVQPTEPVATSADQYWVDTDQLSAYPVIYRSNGSNEWEKLDNSDQTTPMGVIFADARIDADSAIDSDAPDALAYPAGMTLWNTRYSTRVVKEWKKAHVTPLNVDDSGDRWVLRSGTDFDGSLLTGLTAVKKVVVTALASTIVNNDAIRSEFVFYNLIAAPGFPELIDELVGLNIDKKELAFVIGDTPMTLKPDTTSLTNWATNANLAATNGDDGLITRNEYLGIYYPSGLATNLDGTEVVVPPSHMVLRQMAYNDQVAYPWFAPAGLQRGVINNAVSVGYVDDEGEYVPIALNQGQRDALYLNDINPIKMDPNSGVVIWGQKTRYAIDSSAMSRINVARLINYIRYRLDTIVQPFFFQPNDAKTRGQVKTIIDSFLGELITLRGLTDFLVVCDSSNNTPDRIDRNELWIDIAIVPTKAVEFIYIPIRIKATGSDLAA